MQVGSESIEINVAPKLEKEVSEVGYALVWESHGGGMESGLQLKAIHERLWNGLNL